MSSRVVVSGERLRNAASRLQLEMWLLCVVRTKLARVHVLDHALAQRADRIRAHRQLLSWMGARHLDPQDRAPRPPPTISRLGTVLAVRPPRSGLSRSDLVPWHEAADRGSVTSRQILRVEQTCHGRRGTAESDPIAVTRDEASMRDCGDSKPTDALRWLARDQ